MARPSFLHDVLATAGQAELVDLKSRISDVTLHISQLKVRIHDYMKTIYVDFDPSLKRDRNYLEQAIRLSQEMDSLFNRIETQTKRELVNSISELRHLHDTLKVHGQILSISSELMSIDGTLQNIEKATSDKCFYEAAKALVLLENQLQNVSPAVKQLDIFKPLQEEYHMRLDNFCHDRVKTLSSCIVWEETDTAKNITHFSLKVITDDFDTLLEVTRSLHLLNMLNPWLLKLQTALMHSVFLPIMQFQSSCSTSDKEKLSTLSVEIDHRSNNPTCLSVLSELSKLFEFIHGELDIVFENGDSFLSLLGSGISEEFAEKVVKLSLRDRIPSSTTQDGFSEILEMAERFHFYLTDIENNLHILDFVRNVDVLCTNKTCELYLSRARDIMKKDLQDMVKVGPQAPASPLNPDVSDFHFNSTLDQAQTLARDEIEGKNVTIPNLFTFPECFVSKSSIEILNLVNELLNEARSHSEQKGAPLLHTARSIFFLYMAVVPSYHDKFLSTIPQQVALFHNNCMYLSHCLLTLGFELETFTRTELKSSLIVTFVDLVHSLRSLGTSSFLKHMQYQRKQILDIVKNSGLASLGENPNLPPSTEKSLRQCLRQLELLKQVWLGVLPSNVYNKSIGILVNALIEEIVFRVSSVEDIPANTAVDLTSLFDIVSKRIPPFFLNEQEVVLHVKRWRKFQELIQVLGASLRDIEERWADGKGPLAQEFTMEQMKQLIRALFQNTKRRAEVLSKIR